jgi:hypothetical protein
MSGHDESVMSSGWRSGMAVCREPNDPAVQVLFDRDYMLEFQVDDIAGILGIDVRVVTAGTLV